MVARGSPSTSDPKTPQTHPYPCVGDLLLPIVPSGTATEPTRTHGTAPVGRDEPPGALRVDASLGGLQCHAAKRGGTTASPPTHRHPFLHAASPGCWHIRAASSVSPQAVRNQHGTACPLAAMGTARSQPGDFGGAVPTGCATRGTQQGGDGLWIQVEKQREAHADGRTRCCAPYGEHGAEPARGGGGGEDDAPGKGGTAQLDPTGLTGCPHPNPLPQKRSRATASPASSSVSSLSAA